MKPGEIVFKNKTIKGNKILIRYPTKRDVHILRNYINILSKEQTFIMFQGEQVSLEEEIEYLNKQIEKIENNKAVKLLVFNKNKLIGVSDITMQDRASDHIGAFGITVAKEFRNQGIGKLLMKLVLEEAKKKIKDLKIISLGLFAGNKIATKMYKKFGFREYGKLPKGLKYKNSYVDHIYLYKNIRDF
jgi:RimJ/RimL family protein N-acetyltransferase